MKKIITGYVKKVIINLQKTKKWPAFVLRGRTSAGKPAFDIEKIAIDYPKDEKFGDYSTNVAMVLAPILKMKPLNIADELIRSLGPARDDMNKNFEKIETVAPGYINFYLSKKYLHRTITEINKNKQKHGNSNLGKGIKVNNEFISANPTGPLHLGNGRGGFYGDVLSNVLMKAGHKVIKEYYINDAGEQVIKLGHSVLKDSLAGYQGKYIDELNKKLGKEKDVKKAGEEAAQIVMKKIIKETIGQKMKTNFDSWISERSLYGKKYVNKAIGILKEKNLTREKDGALWLKTTKFGDDKDRVLIKSNGEKTYLASDCGYLLYKIQKGFDKIIEIWGADHHGYVKRFEAAARALGFKGDLRFIIVQLVRLVKNGKEARMSKRAGNVIYIDDLIKEVGHDVARFFFLMYAPDTHMNFDLGLAKERSEKNPVYYVQYAHARICSILRKAKIFRSSASLGQNGQKKPSFSASDLLTHEKELSLMKELSKFPELIEEISQNYEVHKLPHYAVKLADKFHSFYGACRVIDEKNPELTSARLMLINAVRIVLAETLRLIGVNAPNKM